MEQRRTSWRRPSNSIPADLYCPIGSRSREDSRGDLFSFNYVKKEKKVRRRGTSPSDSASVISLYDDSDDASSVVSKMPAPSVVPSVAGRKGRTRASKIAKEEEGDRLEETSPKKEENKPGKKRKTLVQYSEDEQGDDENKENPDRGRGGPTPRPGTSFGAMAPPGKVTQKKLKKTNSRSLEETEEKKGDLEEKLVGSSKRKRTAAAEEKKGSLEEKVEEKRKSPRKKEDPAEATGSPMKLRTRTRSGNAEEKKPAKSKKKTPVVKPVETTLEKVPTPSSSQIAADSPSNRVPVPRTSSRRRAMPLSKKRLIEALNLQQTPPRSPPRTPEQPSNSADLPTAPPTPQTPAVPQNTLPLRDFKIILERIRRPFVAPVGPDGEPVVKQEPVSPPPPEQPGPSTAPPPTAVIAPILAPGNVPPPRPADADEDDDDETCAVFKIEENQAGYLALRNAEPSNEYLVEPEYTRSTAELIDASMITRGDRILPGVTRLACHAVANRLGTGFLQLDGKTVLPMLAHSDRDVVYCVIKGAVVVKTAGAFYSRPAIGDDNYFYGSRHGVGASILVRNKTHYSFENWEEEPATLFFSELFQPNHSEEPDAPPTAEGNRNQEEGAVVKIEEAEDGGD